VADGVGHTLDDRGRVRRLNSYEACDSTHERRGDPNPHSTMRLGWGRAEKKSEPRPDGQAGGLSHKKVIARTFTKLF
jgi:hypothetical protein